MKIFENLNTAKPFYQAAFLAFILLLIPTITKSQTDSLSYKQEQQQDSAIAYLSPMEYAFMMHEETKWLLKLNLLIAHEYYQTNTLKLSFERKLATGFSLNAAVKGVMSNYDYELLSYGFEFSLESRWYYKMRKNIREKKSADNLSGAYFALGGGYRMVNSSDAFPDEYSNFNTIPVFAKWGIQKRFLKRGYLDFGLKAGANISLDDNLPTTFLFSTYVDAGLAFARDKQQLDFDKLCPVLRCHAADRIIFKTNLVDIISLGYFRKTFVGSVLPNISAEFKLGQSPFSINTKLSCGLSYSTSWNHDFNIFTVAPQVLVEGRWYYNLNRRILKGKSGNGLSANYISLGGLYRGEFQQLHGGYTDYDNSIRYTGAIIRTGIQRLITKHLYFDVNIGMSYGKEHKYDGANDTTTDQGVINFDLGIAIGYRF